MDGFKPLGDLKNWHIYFVIVAAIIGLIAMSTGVIWIVVWLLNHLKIV